jgi:hypothetical protein
MRSTTFTLLLLTLFVSAPLGQPKAEERGKLMIVKKLTPVLFAEQIEPCLKFWVERLGFEKTIEVPDGNKLAFAILQKGGVELMSLRFRRRFAKARHSCTSRSRISTRSSRP